MKRFLTILFLVAAAVQAQEPATPRVVTISAKKFEFTPNVVTLKKGEPVTLRVSTEDRTHGFYQDNLGIDLDVKPDSPSEITITPQTAGRYTVICDHFCGSGHGNMKMTIVVE